MLEGQTLDMQHYREEKDRLEYEAMMNDPSTAYLVDDAEFDRQIDELGVTEVGTAAGMYIERGMYKVKKAIQNYQNILPHSLGYPRTDRFCSVSMGRLPINAHHVDSAVYPNLPMVTCCRFVLYNSR